MSKNLRHYADSGINYAEKSFMKFATGGTNLIKLYKSRVGDSPNDATTLSIMTLDITSLRIAIEKAKT